ncbi:MAG: putative metal-binding motif-containing protein [Sandaracinus sp.]|nr:putative metal-binding motif-containing protein [Sandaracinus sp.]
MAARTATTPDPDRFPGNVEICDSVGHDEDCDPATFGDRDADGDGFVDALCCNDFEGTMRCGDDCNDRRRDAHPGVPEVCEGLDNDCDGSIDEGLLRMQWPDADRDLHGDEASEGVMVCPGEPGYSPVRDDCDDTAPTRHRAQLEICDGLDNDCDGVSDEAPVSVPWYPDEDDDGFGAAGGTVVISCAPVPGYSTRSSDCNDADRMVNPAAAERCNGIDDDCDGFADAPGTGPATPKTTTETESRTSSVAAAIATTRTPSSDRVRKSSATASTTTATASSTARTRTRSGTSTAIATATATKARRRSSRASHSRRGCHGAVTATTKTRACDPGCATCATTSIKTATDESTKAGFVSRSSRTRTATVGASRIQAR